MTTIHKIEGGLVTSSALIDPTTHTASSWSTLTGETWVDDPSGLAGIGWSYDGSNFTAPAGPTLSERAAQITLPAARFWPAVGDALSLTAAQRPAKTYVQDQIPSSMRLTSDQQELAIDILEAANFARADESKEILETIAMDLGFGAGGLGPSPTEAELLAAAQGALDIMFDAANGGTGT